MNIDISTSDLSGNKSMIKGFWHNLRWRPNESTGEILNIGVVLKTPDGIPHVRVIDTFDRLSCLYDMTLATDARFLVRVVQDAVLAGIRMPSSSVYLSEPKFASGESALVILDQLFYATVPLGRPKALSREKLKIALPENTTSVRQEVLNALREIAGLNADRIISTEKTMLVVEEGKAHPLDIPLQTHNALGTIVSARYGDRQKTELNILRADSDLQIARKVYKQDRLYMYVVRHEQEMYAEKIDSLLEEFGWKFKKFGISMKSYTHPKQVANDIVEDMSLS